MSAYVEHKAEPIPGTVRDTFGDPCPRAVSIWDYPLCARCRTCGETVRCADGSADWIHVVRTW